MWVETNGAFVNEAGQAQAYPTKYNPLLAGLKIRPDWFNPGIRFRVSYEDFQSVAGR
jgi:hypothetical protein